MVDGPLSLIEVGVSAGLCLYPDRYSHLYDGHRYLHPVKEGIRGHCQVTAMSLDSQ